MSDKLKPTAAVSPMESFTDKGNNGALNGQYSAMPSHTEGPNLKSSVTETRDTSAKSERMTFRGE